MTKRQYFSSKLRYLIFVGDDPATLGNDQVYVFRANDFDAAFERALHLGIAGEKAYKNHLSQDVRWRFAEVISLDILPSEDLDSIEIYSEPVHFSDTDALSTNCELNPSKSKPTQTL